MKTIYYLILLTLTILGPTRQASAIPIISLDTHPTKIHAGNNIFLDVNISGLQSAGFTALLGAFSMDVLFDPNLVFLPSLSTFGNSLGNIGAGEAVVGATPPAQGSGLFSFFEVSTLEGRISTCFFCTGPYLENLQTDSFTLATLAFFDSSQNPVPGPTASFAATNWLLSDDMGNEITTQNSLAVVTVTVDEPPLLLLLGIGLISSCLKSRPRRFSKGAKIENSRHPNRLPPYCHFFILFTFAILISISDPLKAASKTEEPSKVASSVQQLIDNINVQMQTARRIVTDLSTLSNDLLHVDANGRIELLFHAAGKIGTDEEQDLKSLGAEIVTKLESPGMIQAWVSHDKIDEAASLPWVVVVTPPDYGHVDEGSVESEGVQLHHVDGAQIRGANGNGIKVGVISDGVSHLADAQASCDPANPTSCNLPKTVNVLAAGLGDEGTAMLEIIHDMAPDAALWFQATGNGVINHVNALNALVNAGVNVIAEDIAFDAQPAFQKGVAATTAEQIAANGISVHSSAGNLGLTHAARVEAIGTGKGPDGNAGPFTNCGGFPPSNTVDLNPDPNNVDTTFDITIPAGTPANPANSTFTLQWSEPRSIAPTAGAGGFTDLDLFIMDAAGTTCLARSVALQSNGAGDTIEQISYVNTGAAARAKIVVNNAGNHGAKAIPLIDLRWRGATAIDPAVRGGSLNPDSNYTALATSAAAVNAVSGAIEGFSAGGPVYLGLTTVCPNNSYPCPGASVAGAGVATSPGPTWAAADGVLVSGAGGFGCNPQIPGSPCRFFGTSAAAPHAASCDALARQIFGANTAVATINARLVNKAQDLLPAGNDNVTGAGLLDCFAALGTICDVNRDESINRLDIKLIGDKLNTPAVPPFDLRDANNNGKIEVLDARICTTRCTKPNCAI